MILFSSVMWFGLIAPSFAAFALVFFRRRP
jgi:hypothetical protein